jgi:formylmethanofuran dehydrogenase subunit A
MMPSIKVERQESTDANWYEVMLSPFVSEEQAFDYIQKYRHYYPIESQNYKITHSIGNSETTHYFRGCFV